MTLPTPHRGPHCLSKLQMDELLTESADAPSQESMNGHLKDCLRCRGRYRNLVAEHAAFANVAPPAFVRRDQGRGQGRPRRSMVALVVPALAAAALLLFLQDPDLPASPEVRSKGGAPSLGLQVKRGQTTFVAAPEATLLPDDTLQFVVPQKPGEHVAIFNIEENGSVTAFHPVGRKTTVALLDSPGPEVILPGAIVLDNSVGREQLVAMFCDRSLEVERAEHVLSRRSVAEAAETLGCRAVIRQVFKADAP